MFHEFEQVKREYDELFETVLRDKVINTEISPEDGMFPPGQEKARYFGVGLSALRAISVALALAGKTPAGIYTVLDFACGHGRVARMLRAAFPQAHLTVSDVDQKGMAFCARTFQAEPAPSSRDLAKLRLNRRFDLIWCGSLLTHLDSPQWIEVLRFFRDHLNPMGVMIFTTHGRYVADRLHRRTGPYRLTEDQIVRVLNAYWREDFGFSCYNDNLNYGISVANPSWVIKLIEQYPDIHLLNFTEKGWDKHQDVVAASKLAAVKSS